MCRNFSLFNHTFTSNYACTYEYLQANVFYNKDLESNLLKNPVSNLVLNPVLIPVFYFQINKGDIVHMETRECSLGTFGEMDDGEGSPRVAEHRVDVLLRVDIKHSGLVHFLKSLKRSSFLSDVHLLSSRSINMTCKENRRELHI